MKIIAAAVLVAIISVAFVGFGNDPMKECQKTHSYETCFYQLNRQEITMARIKDWLLDIEYYVFEARQEGLTEVEDITSYVSRMMKGAVDSRYVEALLDNREVPDWLY